MNVLDEIVQEQLRSDLPELATGDTVRVSAKVVEGNRERIQVFEGTVMRMRGGGITRSITVRRIASGVGVERTFKVHSPRIEKIEVVRHGQVRRGVHQLAERGPQQPPAIPRDDERREQRRRKLRETAHERLLHTLTPETLTTTGSIRTTSSTGKTKRVSGTTSFAGNA